MYEFPIFMRVRVIIPYVGKCAGFSDACVMEPSTRTTAGVGEAPRHEIAEYGAGRLSAAYGDLATAWRVEIGRNPI